MEHSFDPALMAPRNKRRVWPLLMAFLVATMAWHATARADDILDRSMNFHIAPSPLAGALIEFSTQSGLQVAAADAEVSHLNSNGVNGTFPAHVALDLLLHGTGLGFTRVGATTVAIGSVPENRAPTRTGRSSDLTKIEAITLPQPDHNVNAGASPEIPDVTVTAPRPPTDQELAGNGLRQFIAHHATVHYENTGARGNLAHWRGGKQSICPQTEGLTPAYNAFVTARIRAVAENVGAPVQSDSQCKDNVRIVFTNDPLKIMNDVVEWASVYFGVRYPAMRPLIAFRGDHPIQGWYMTTRRRSSVMNTDVGLLALNLQPVWPKVIPIGLKDDGDMSGIGVVILVVDTTKIASYPIGAIADYLAMLTLSVAQSPDHCDPLPSILDLMSASCATREKPSAITAGDLAFLKALYYRNTGIGSSPSRDDIQITMMREFRGH